MSQSEALARSMARRAATLADLSREELTEFGGWLLDMMARLIVVHDAEVVAMDVRLAANQAFELGALSEAQQRALGAWVENSLDELRALDRRSPGRSDRRASNRFSVFDEYVATVESAGFRWVMGGGPEGYCAAVTRSPHGELPVHLLQPAAARSPTPLTALREAMRHAAAARTGE